MVRVSRGVGRGITVAVVMAAASAVQAQSTWNNSAANSLWNDPGNWTAGVPDTAGEDALFAGAGLGNVDINNGGAGFSLNTVTFSAGGYTLIDATGDNDTLNAAGGIFFNAGTNEVVGARMGNSDITLGGAGAVLKLTATVQTVNGLWAGRYVFDGAQSDITFSNGGGGYTVQADKPFTGQGGVLTRTPNAVFAANGNLAFSTGGAPGGAGDQFVIAWTGTFTPDASNDYAFRVTNSGNTGGADDHGSIYIDFNQDGIFQTSEGVATSDQASTSAFALTAGQQYNIAIGFNEDSGNESWSARMSVGGGSFNTIDAGSGLFTRLATTGPVSTGDVNVVEDGTIDVTQTVGNALWTYDSLNVSAGKTFTKIGDGRLKFTGASSGDGAIAISAGSLEVTADGGLGSVVGGTTVNSGGQLVISAAYATAEPLTLNGAGPGSSGALAAEATASFAGPITLASAATISSQTAAETFTIDGTIDNGGFELQLDGVGNVSLAGGVSGSGGLRKTGNGTATVTAVTAYTGATIAEDGILSLNTAGALPSTSGISIPNGGTLQVASANALTAGNTVTLSAGGRLRATNSNGVSTNVTIPAGGILDIGVNNGLANAAVITRDVGAIVRVSNATGLNGAQLPAADIDAGAIVQMNTNNIANLNNVGPGVVLEVFGGNRQQTNNAAFDITGNILTNQGVNRVMTNGTNAITFGAAGATIAASNSTTFEFDEQIAAAGNPVTFGSTASLNGLAKGGTVRFDSSVDIGVGTIAAGTVRFNQGSSLSVGSTVNISAGAVDIYEGDTGANNDVLGTLNLSNGRLITLRVDEPAAGNDPFINTLNAPINVLDDVGNNILRAARDGDSSVNSYGYFANVSLADGARLRIQQESDQRTVVSAAVPAGSATINHIDDANRDFLGNLSGPGELTLTGTSEINLVGALSTRLNVGGASGAGHLDLAGTPDATLAGVFGTGWTAPSGTLVIGAGGDVDVETDGTLGALIFNGGALNVGSATLSITNQLGGSGTLPLAGISIGTNVQLTPGASAGILTLTGDLAVADTMSYLFEIGDTPALSDSITVSGELTLGNVLNLELANIGNDTDLSGDTYVLFSYGGADPTLPTTINFTGGLSGDVSIDGANNQVLLTNVVPEPATISLFGLAAAGLLASRRRTRRA